MLEDEEQRDGYNRDIAKCQKRQDWQGEYLDRFLEALNQYIDQFQLIDDNSQWLNVNEYIAQNHFRDEV